MQWILIKTWVGREEELAEEIKRILPPYCYQECFVIYQERIWRKQQRNIIHREKLFPGYVFLTCDSGAWLSGEISDRLSMTTSFLCKDATVFPMIEEDAAFLKKLSGDEHSVKLSYVLKDDKGNVCRLSEPLCICQGEIERIQFKKRYAMVRRKLWGEEQVIVLGIVLKEDAGQKLLPEEDKEIWKDFLMEDLTKEMA